MTYIRENKYDLADKTLKQLEDNKASLPTSVQTQLPTARTALTPRSLARRRSRVGFHCRR
jgi:hypothetical protein